MKTNTQAIFMIEGGPALELIKTHIADRQRVRDEVAALANTLGVSHAETDRFTGVLRGIVLDGKTHPDFNKPTAKGISYPKKGKSWAKIFAAQVGYKPAGVCIQEAFSVPHSIDYETGSGHGIRCIGQPFTPFGFLFMGEDGPYAMWVPDVPAEVAASEALGQKVNEPAKSFKLEFEGCRRIQPEEWEILVLQEKLKRKGQPA